VVTNARTRICSSAKHTSRLLTPFKPCHKDASTTHLDVDFPSALAGLEFRRVSHDGRTRQLGHLADDLAKDVLVEKVPKIQLIPAPDASGVSCDCGMRCSAALPSVQSSGLCHVEQVEGFLNLRSWRVSA